MKLPSVKTFGLIAVTVILVSGVLFYIKNVRGSSTVLVPVERSIMPQTPRHKPPAPRIEIHPVVDSPPKPVRKVMEPVVIDRPEDRDIHHDIHRDRDGNKGREKEGEKEREKQKVNVEVPVETQLDNNKLLSKLKEQKLTGQVNYDIWWNLVGYYVDDMRLYKDFPNQPDERKTLDQLHIRFDGMDIHAPTGRYGHKIYGYLILPKPGRYVFKFTMSDLTAAASAELWVSSGTSPLDIKKRLVLEYDDMDRPTERKATTQDKIVDIVFKDSIYYFEYLMKAYEGRATVDLTWKIPDSQSFVAIPSEVLAMAVQLNEQGGIVEGEMSKILQNPLPSKRLQTHHRAYYVGNIIYQIKSLEVLPECEFYAEYAKPRRVKAYTGVSQVHGSKVYPKDDTWFKNWYADDKGNAVIEKETAKRVVTMYKEAFNKSKINGHVEQLVNLEETPNGKQGSRFLLELMIRLNNPPEIINTSEYVYLPALGESKLCHISNFQWRHNGVHVYLAVAVKNLGFWIRHLMQNVEEIYDATQDNAFTLIVTDYESEDTSVREIMSKSPFKRWELIEKKGPFSRAGGLQACIDFVKDPDSIVMTIDMHLTLPIGFIEAVRRHTVQGKMGYTPFFFRLHKGYTEINYNGFWETLTYGLFGMYKSDWGNFGGFNLRKYTNKWGGEDWDILDRALAKGYEVFRIRVPGLVHYDHTKAGMWGGKAHD